MKQPRLKRSATVEKAIRNPWTIAIVIYSVFMTYAFLLR